jgi:3-keto-5-aminohexanoate cleavage enzyme
MEKLIITVTVDSSMSYPGNHYCPPPTMENVGKIVDEYVRAVNAGASMCHIHGVHKLEDKIDEDGKKLSHINFEGWQTMHQESNQVDCLLHMGSPRRGLKKKALMDQVLT